MVLPGVLDPLVNGVVALLACEGVPVLVLGVLGGGGGALFSVMVTLGLDFPLLVSVSFVVGANGLSLCCRLFSSSSLVLLYSWS